MKRLQSLLAGCLLVLTPGLSLQSRAQTKTTTFDFNTDPTGILDIRESFEGEPSPAWRPTGGVDNSGYLAITDANPGERRVIVFDDFNDGAIVSSFTFSCDLRTGGGTDNPADGYSISFAREDDPVITGGPFASSPGNEANLPEEGTQTGISIGLDEWDSGSGDVVGLSVRVDNVLIHQQPMTTRNGGPADTTSLQTGPAGVSLDEDWNLPDHSFVNLTIHLDEDGTLDVTFKGVKILDNFQTSYFPSRGRIILAGRTGGSTSHHHVDNIVITTTSATQPTVSMLTLTATDLIIEITDSANQAFDASKPVTVTFDGTPIEMVVQKTGNVTRLTRPAVLPDLYPPGTHEIVITAVDTNNNPLTITPTPQTAPYTPLNPAWAAAPGQVNLSQPGFRARVHQLSFPRYPGDMNLLPLPERQLAGGFFDILTGAPAANVADPGTEPDGTFLIPGVLNWDQDVSGIGSFAEDETEIPGIPGSTGSTDYIAAELIAWLDLPAGVTTLGVNSDDGFTVSFGANPLDFFTRVKAGEFNGGRGSADSTFDIGVPVAGLYPVRIIWWEGEGGANFEFFSVTEGGTKILVNDTATPGHIKAYYGGAPSVPAIHTISPYPGITDNDPRHALRIELTDGTATVNDNTIALKINGEAVTPVIENNGGTTIVSYLPAGGHWPVTSNTVELSFEDSAGGARTETWSFGVNHFQILTIADGVPAASVSVPGYTARPWQVEFREGASGDIVTTYNESAEGMLAGLFGPNIADLTGSDNGVFFFSGVLNWDQDLAGVGNFGDDSPIPGAPGGAVDCIAVEVLTWLVFPSPGQYVMGVNSDDNFRVTLGHSGPTRHLLELTGSNTISGPQPAADGTRRFGSIGEPLNGVLEAAVIAADPIDAVTPLTNAADAAGKIVYIDRGNIEFAVKIRHAQEAGALGVIIGNNQAGYPIVMGGSSEGLTIPAVMTSQDVGTAIKAALQAGDPLRASFGYDTTRRFGEFQGGRGAADSLFAFEVKDPGAYPFRLIWQEGGGGANCEWFTVLPDGEKVLINDSTHPQSIRAFQVAQPAEVFFITDASVNKATGEVSVTWESEAGAAYRVESSPDLQNWTTVADNVAGAAGSTTFNGSVAEIPTAAKLYLRVRKL